MAWAAAALSAVGTEALASAAASTVGQVASSVGGAVASEAVGSAATSLLGSAGGGTMEALKAAGGSMTDLGTGSGTTPAAVDSRAPSPREKSTGEILGEAMASGKGGSKSPQMPSNNVSGFQDIPQAGVTEAPPQSQEYARSRNSLAYASREAAPEETEMEFKGFDKHLEEAFNI